MNNTLRAYIVVFLFLFVAQISMEAQIEQPFRYEIKYEWQYENHLVISNEERGLTLVRTDRDNTGRDYPVKFTHLNNKLEEVWKDSIEVEGRMFLRGYHHQKDKLFVMFQDYPVRKRINVLSLDYNTQKVTSHETSQIAELDLQEFEVIQNTAILGGYFEQRPVVFAYDLEKNTVKAVQGVYKNDSRLLEVRINKDSVTFNVLVAEMNEERDQTIIVSTYDYEGNPVRGYELETKKDYSLIDGVSSSINEVSQVIVGNYGYKSNTLPSGIYINYINRQGEQTMNYLNYADLDRFLDYQGKNRAEKAKVKATEIKEKGREQRYKLQALARELVEIDDKLILQAEYFRPGSSRNPTSRNFSDFNRRNDGGRDFADMVRDINSTPIGSYDFTHAYALVMDLKGKVLWDDSFRMNYTLQGPLDQHGRFQWEKEKQHLVYSHYDGLEETVFAKVLDGTGENVISTATLEVGSEFEKREEVRASVLMQRWYGEYFVAYGIQAVRPKDKSGGAERVYFINAIKLNPKSPNSKLD